MITLFEGIAIILVVCVVVFLQAYIDFVKELKFRQLNSIKVSAVQVDTLTQHQLTPRVLK